ncbi:MAG: leucine-rich repeat domain-containing protein, partial [Treponema sp.]|nr:leucine-rich repeat domain-containing protein [Treponema sp.]
MKNPLISILFACIFALIITACTPKKTENTESQSHEQRPEGTEIVTNFTSDYSYLHNQDAAPRQVGDFVIQGTELKGYYGSNRNLTIPVDLGVNAIGWSAFSHSSVSSITIPKEILSIHENAFENCHSLQSITVSNDNENYASADGTLFNKQKTDMLYVPHGRSGTFSVPDTITEIREYTFVSRHALTSINIPASVTKIGSGGDVFDGAVRLTSINVDRNNSSYASVDGILYDKAVTTIIHFPQDIQGVISIPNTVTTIGNDVLRRRIGITSFNIPNSVATIGDRAFLECSNLTSINIPGSVKTIGDEAFSACTSLRTVTFNEGLVSIGERAFYNCTAVENINIPASVTRIGTGAFAAHDSENWYYMGGIFSGSSSLASITADQRSQIFSSVDGVLFNKAVTELLHFPQGKGGAYSIPNTVTRIEDFAFSYRNNLTSVTIPASVTSIGTDAFFGCSNLTS